ncbi:MAG: hypothetical protein ACXVGH_06960 [Mycobacteriales bacterium]
MSAPRDVLTGRASDGSNSVVGPVNRSRRPLSRSVSRGSGQPGLYRSTSALSTWVVHYNGFTQVAQDAFQRAVDTWAHTVYSSVPIVVNADLTAFSDPAQLGGAGPAAYWGTSGVVAYPIALANAMDGKDHLDSTQTTYPSEDIDASFSSNSSLFYYGADPSGIATASCTDDPSVAPTAGSCYDFESVVLHELGHGLGFLGSAQQGTNGSLAYSSTPLVYDYFTETADGRPILDYPNGSTELAGALQGNALYWSGAFGASADRGREPRLFAPSSWLEGSSYSHLSDASYPQGDPDSLMTPYADAGDITRDPGEVMLGMFRDMGWVTPELPGSRFTPVSYRRVLDTNGYLGNGGYRDITMAGAFGVPSNATAVLLDLTSYPPKARNEVRAYAYPRAIGSPLPEVSSVVARAGETRDNLAVAPIGRLGRVRVFTSGGASHITATLVGYYSEQSTAGSTAYVPATRAVRVMDTQFGIGVRKGVVGPGGIVTLQVTGRNGVPSTATAVTLTLSALGATTGTAEQAWPYGGAQPLPVLHLRAKENAANQVVVRVGSGGKVSFRNNTGSVRLVADLSGWYDPNASGGLFRPTLPTRVTGFRIGTGTRSVGISDANDSGDTGVPSTATAAVLNLSGGGGNANTSLVAYPYGTTPPGTLNILLAPYQTASALSTTRLGSNGLVTLRNNAGSVNIYADTFGWFGP